MVRYAVVGAGWIAQEAFMPGAAQSGNSRVAAIVSGDPEKAGRLARFHHVPRVVPYAGYDALVAGDEIDAVYIALPNPMHADYAIRAARAGKHVMVEKPLACTVDEAEAMIAAAREAGVFLMTAYDSSLDRGQPSGGRGPRGKAAAPDFGRRRNPAASAPRRADAIASAGAAAPGFGTRRRRGAPLRLRAYAL